MHKMSVDDTIVAISTPVGEGGIGIVRLSGPSSLAIAEKIYISADGKSPSEYRTHTTHYGKIKALKGSEIVDEVLLTVMRAPKSYTREDIVEINCHGGIQSVRKVLNLTVKCGARIAEPGEFTKRAFLNGRIDLAQAEAVLDVIRAKTEGSLKVAMGQLEGELSKKIGEIREEMLGIASEIEAAIDFSEEDVGALDKLKLLRRIEKVTADLERLIGTYDGGSVLREGVLAIICGKPNVGKSSLMNLLLKRDRVIVSPIPGTTRDAVEEMINLRDIPIRLVDTAGIIETKDSLEKESIVRSKKYLAVADIAIVILDCSEELNEADRSIMAMVEGKKRIVVLNKTDLAEKIDTNKMPELFKNDRIVKISVEKRKNIDLLEKEIADTIWSGGFTQGESAILSDARHKELLDKALINMLSVKKAIEADEPPEIMAIDLKEAIVGLGFVTGKSISDDILERVFERFCIGK